MSSSNRHRIAATQQLEFGFAEEPSSAPAVRTVERSPDPAPCMAVVAPAPATAPAQNLQDAADRLHAELIARTGLELRLRITNNRSTMMTIRYEANGRCAILGLHHMFLGAPEDVRKALAAWVLKPKAKVPGRKLQAFIEAQRHLIARRTPKSIVIRTAGVCFDLRALYNRVNDECFGGEVTSPITWGKMPAGRRRRSIRFGSFSPGEDLIRIHPLLDQEFVPEFFIRYIVFHEMLHAHMGIEESPSGRRRIHPPAFRKREAAYEDYNRAIAWLENEKNLRRLLQAPGK